jgi:hypothetical protein
MDGGAGAGGLRPLDYAADRSIMQLRPRGRPSPAPSDSRLFSAFARLDEQSGGLFHTEDFIEGRKAEAEGRPPVYQGK